MRSKIVYLCLTLALLLSLVACKGQTDEQDSQPPTTPTIAPTQEPTPTPTPPIPYTDVPEDAAYYDMVVWAYKKGIASDGSTFEPASTCTRSQAIMFLWRAMGSPEPQITECPISDVSPSDWFYKPVLWAYESGISTSSTFNPGNSCSNAEALTFLWRAEGKPAAAVHNSPVALAASGAYYERPAAWAEVNGMFAGMGSSFDPSAPCTRADLMTYLHWLTEEWTFAEEDKALQAEYEQIINDAQLFEVHGSGLVYADYVDVDNDGKVELLTVDIGGGDVTATVYKGIDGHATKYADTGWGSMPDTFSICQSDSKAYLCYYSDLNEVAHDFWTVENGEFVYAEGAAKGFNGYWGLFPYEEQITETEYNALLQKYTNHVEIFRYESSHTSIKNRGLLPSENEYWINYWETVNPSYAAVLKGDFSAFAGNYSSGDGSGKFSLDWGFALNADGSIISNHPQFASNQKPLSVTITEEGRISCVLKTENRDGYTYRESYEICPIGLGHESYYDGQMGEDVIMDKSKVQIFYYWQEQGNSFTGYCKVS